MQKKNISVTVSVTSVCAGCWKCINSAYEKIKTPTVLYKQNKVTKESYKLYSGSQ